MKNEIRENRIKWLKIRNEISKFGEFGVLYSDSWKRKDGSVMRRRKFVFEIKKGMLEEVWKRLVKGYGKVKVFEMRNLKRCYEFRVYEVIG